jgi:ubiquitin-protein ligase E3 A
MVVDPKHIFVAYFYQLSVGCDAVHCTTKHCRSCPDFPFTFTDPDDIADRAITFAWNHSKQPSLCPGLSPFYFHPELYTQLNEFATVISALDRDSGVSLSAADISRAIGGALTDAAVFSSLLLSNTAKLTANNLALGSEVNDLVGIVSQNCALFSPFAAEFSGMLVKLVEGEKVTFRAIRGALLAFCFLPLLVGPRVGSFVEPFFSKILGWPEDAKKIFGDWLSKFPKLLSQALVICQTNLTVWSLSLLSDRGMTVDGADQAVKSAPPRILARMISALREVSLKTEATFDSDEFANEPFTSLLSPRGQLFVPRQEWTYIQTPAVLTLSFKSELLRLYAALTQQARMQEDFIVRGGNVTRRDLHLYLEVSRHDIVRDALQILQHVDQDGLLRKLIVVFKGEQGVDAGGVSREFFYLLCNDAFSPDYGLFRKVSGGKYWFRSDPLQAPIFFSLLGTIVALALYNSIVLPIRFPRLLYKKLCQKRLFLKDLVEIEPEVVQSFEALRNMRDEGESVADCSLTFAITTERLDRGEPVFPLKPGGESITVTNENLEEYIELYSDYIMNKSVERPFDLFQRGFQKVLVRLEQVQIFQYDELDLLVSGVDVLDWGQLQTNAKYSDGYTPDSRIVQWFWEVFSELSDDHKRWLLRFATGTDRTPVSGLSDVVLTIQRAGDPEKLPVAHTCFNILTLPDYPTKDTLKKKLMIAIEHNEGFGLI